MAVCRDCDELFDPKNSFHKKGYIDQCGYCADDVPKHLGRMGGDKSNNQCVVFRENHQFVQSILNMEKGAGMRPNLIMSSPTSPTWEDIQEKKEE